MAATAFASAVLMSASSALTFPAALTSMALISDRNSTGALLLRF